MADLMVTVFEGGSNGWLRSVYYDAAFVPTPDSAWYSQAAFWDQDVFDIEATPHEDDAVTFNRAGIERGIQLLFKRFPNFTMGTHDATEADVFFQGCCFGEIIYG
jgi:hypothetical protein